MSTERIPWNIREKEKEEKKKMLNVLLPERTFEKSARALDDDTLSQQIVDLKIILDNIEETKRTRTHHPIVEHYKNNKNIIGGYAHACLAEYAYRFGKAHRFVDCFNDYLGEYSDCRRKRPYECDVLEWGTPIYAERSKFDPNCIRETGEKVFDLFKAYLVKKWSEDEDDDFHPVWTKIDKPEFWMKMEAWLNGGND